MTFLVDTDWLLDAEEDSGAAQDILEALSDRGLAISILTLGEVYAGIVGRSDEAPRLAAFHRFIRSYEVVGLSASIMLRYARVQHELERQGQRLDDVDLLIAATALDTGRVLITRNRRHFDRVPGLQVY